MGHLLYLMFRCDRDVMKSLEFLWDLNTPKEDFQEVPRNSFAPPLPSADNRPVHQKLSCKEPVVSFIKPSD